MTPAAILVAGSANLDFVVHAERIPAPGETVLGRGFATHPGGKGANQAVACARAGGVPTQMLLALGDDPFAATLEASLAAAGVVLHVVRATAQPTGTAFICVGDDAENAITVAPGANALLRPEHLPSLAGIGHLMLQLETPLDTVLAHARAARAAGVRVVLNAAPAQRLPAALLDAIDLLIVNRGELAAITGVADDVEAALDRLDVPTVVVTLGRDGCRARHHGQALDCPAFPVTAVDTTAAGDTFCGACVAALAVGLPLGEALRRASAAAALACTRPGAQASIPTARDVQAFLDARPPVT
ncbi:MAG: ribokinase [Pseudomonadota bacterium]